MKGQGMRRVGYRSRIAAAVAMLIVLWCSGLALAQASDLPVERQSFLKVIWTGAELPGVVIGLLSLASVTVIIEHFWTIRRGTMFPPEELETTRRLIEERRFKECVEYVRQRSSMFGDVLTGSLRHGRHGFDAMIEAAEQRAAAWRSRLFRKVEYLNIIGNLGPLMGLLGTVVGMIRAFTAMQATHGAYKPEDLAGGIGLALVNTFLGLAVAIVSLGFFGVCRNRVESFTVATHAGVVDLLEYFRPTTTAASEPAAPKDKTAGPGPRGHGSPASGAEG